jgi:hypothetical protein
VGTIAYFNTACNIQSSAIKESSSLVGINTGSITLTEQLQVNGLDVLSTGTGAGFEWGDRTASYSEYAAWYSLNGVSLFYRSDATPTNLIGILSNGDVGIGTTSPSANLEVNGPVKFDNSLTMNSSTAAEPLTMNSIGSATATAGTNSNSFDLISSSYNSGTSSAVAQQFQWQAEPTGNDTANPSGTLNLLFGSGGSSPAETGLSINSSGIFSFNSAQTFPNTVGNPANPTGASGTQGVIYHMDGVKYTSLYNLITNLPSTTSAVTIYDDCPTGAETISNNPFSSGPASLTLQIISAPCLYTFNVPPVLGSGDQWIGAPGGYNQTQLASPTVSGTVFKMGPDMNGQVALPTLVPTASYVQHSGTDPMCPAMTSLNSGDNYWLAFTAISAVGETPLPSGNRTQGSYADLGPDPGMNYSIKYFTPASFAPNQTGVGVYLIDSGSSTSLTGQDASWQTYQTTLGGHAYISSFNSGNPRRPT